jgi:hypothetical protein
MEKKLIIGAGISIFFLANLSQATDQIEQKI